jgi:hypothetical protein
VPAKIRCSADAYNLVGPILADLSYEEFWIIRKLSVWYI